MRLRSFLLIGCMATAVGCAGWMAPEPQGFALLPPSTDGTFAFAATDETRLGLLVVTYQWDRLGAGCTRVGAEIPGAAMANWFSGALASHVAAVVELGRKGYEPVVLSAIGTRECVEFQTEFSWGSSADNEARPLALSDSVRLSGTAAQLPSRANARLIELASELFREQGISRFVLLDTWASVPNLNESFYWEDPALVVVDLDLRQISGYPMETVIGRNLGEDLQAAVSSLLAPIPPVQQSGPLF